MVCFYFKVGRKLNFKSGTRQGRKGKFAESLGAKSSAVWRHGHWSRSQVPYHHDRVLPRGHGHLVSVWRHEWEFFPEHFQVVTKNRWTCKRGRGKDAGGEQMWYGTTKKSGSRKRRAARSESWDTLPWDKRLVKFERWKSFYGADPRHFTQSLSACRGRTGEIWQGKKEESSLRKAKRSEGLLLIYEGEGRDNFVKPRFIIGCDGTRTAEWSEWTGESTHQRHDLQQSWRLSFLLIWIFFLQNVVSY